MWWQPDEALHWRAPIDDRQSLQGGPVDGVPQKTQDCEDVFAGRARIDHGGERGLQRAHLIKPTAGATILPRGAVLEVRR